MIFDVIWFTRIDAWHIGVLIGFGAGVVQILAGGPTRKRDPVPSPRFATT